MTRWHSSLLPPNERECIIPVEGQRNPIFTTALSRERTGIGQERVLTMALGLNNTIVANDIYHIQMFKDLKVFLLVGGNNDKVVIKTDAIHAPQIRSANPIIKAIAPSAKLKILTD